MPSPTYKQNKEHIYKWRKQNNEEYKIIQMRCYYKKKIQCPIWREVKYEFLDILI
jgi:hypothetical protein